MGGRAAVAGGRPAAGDWAAVVAVPGGVKVAAAGSAAAARRPVVVGGGDAAAAGSQAGGGWQQPGERRALRKAAAASDIGASHQWWPAMVTAKVHGDRQGLAWRLWRSGGGRVGTAGKDGRSSRRQPRGLAAATSRLRWPTGA
jgi:hypothetical protein